MPVRIPSTLPAVEELKNENIFVIDEQRASTQDIRPLRIAILNLMPLKLMTETDLLRLISNTPLQVELDLVLPDGHEWTNTPKEHLDTFYKSFDEIKSNNYDGFIVTGAPVEMVDFETVDYWTQLQEIFDWSRKHVTSTIYICWAALAGLYHNYGIRKHVLSSKISGVFRHRVLEKNNPLFRGFDDEFFVLVPDKDHAGCFLPYLFVVLKEGYTVKDIKDGVKDCLEDYMQPVDIIQLKERPFFHFKTNRIGLTQAILADNLSDLY